MGVTYRNRHLASSVKPRLTFSLSLGEKKKQRKKRQKPNKTIKTDAYKPKEIPARSKELEDYTVFELLEMKYCLRPRDCQTYLVFSALTLNGETPRTRSCSSPFAICKTDPIATSERWARRLPSGEVEDTYLLSAAFANASPLGSNTLIFSFVSRMDFRKRVEVFFFWYSSVAVF